MKWPNSSDSSYAGNFLYFQRKSVIEEIEALLDVL